MRQLSQAAVNGLDQRRRKGPLHCSGLEQALGSLTRATGSGFFTSCNTGQQCTCVRTHQFDAESLIQLGGGHTYALTGAGSPGARQDFKSFLGGLSPTTKGFYQQS